MVSVPSYRTKREEQVTLKSKTGYRITVNHNYCTGCGNCIQYCPMHVLERDTQLNKRGVYAPVVASAEKCTDCQLCEMYCGNFSIAVGANPNPGEKGAL